MSRSHRPPRPAGLIGRIALAARVLAFGHLRVKRRDHGIQLTWGETMLAPSATTTALPPADAAPAAASTTPAVPPVGAVAVPLRPAAATTPAAAAATAAPEAPEADAAPEDRRAAVQEALSVLGKALDARRGSRKVLRHLAYFEQSLGRLGDAALDQVPLNTLLKAHEQLEMVAEAAPSPALELIAGWMTDALVRRCAEGDADPGWDCGPIPTPDTQEGALDEIPSDVRFPELSLPAEAAADASARR